jgi:hypothetical protein
MTPVHVLIKGDVTFMGRVVAKEWLIGMVGMEEIPKAGTIISIGEATSGESKFEGSYMVSEVDVHCPNGFSDPTVTVTLTNLP